MTESLPGWAPWLCPVLQDLVTRVGPMMANVGARNGELSLVASDPARLLSESMSACLGCNTKWQIDGILVLPDLKAKPAPLDICLACRA